jgi:hypothetical protein
MERGILALLTAMLLVSGVTNAKADGFIVDFNGLSTGTVVSSVGGVGFSYVPHQFESAGYPLVVSTGFASSSGGKYLGVQDGRSEFFQPGDAVGLSLGSAVDHLAVTFIAPSGAPNGAFGLRSGIDSVTSTAANRVVLSTGDVAVTLHLTLPSAFSNATAFSNASLAPKFSLDDVIVPEPTASMLLGAGLAGLYGLGRRKPRIR